MFRAFLTATSLCMLCAGAARAQGCWEGEFTIASCWNSLVVDVPEGRSDEGLVLCHS